MDQEPEVIRQQIDQTRSALTEKLETLENQVRDTVTSAKSTVEETIGNVKSTVHETVATVKRTFDLPYQVERHPWGMFGGSILVGYLVGTLWPGRPAGRGALGPSGNICGDGPVPGGATAASHEIERRGGSILAAGPVEQGAPSQPGLLSRFLHQFDDEIEQVKQLAIGAAMGALQNVVREALPQFGPQVDKVMESATVKMGGRPSLHPSAVPEPATASSPRR